jgi:hypothetical protein
MYGMGTDIIVCAAEAMSAKIFACNRTTYANVNIEKIKGNVIFEPIRVMNVAFLLALTENLCSSLSLSSHAILP